MNNRSQKIKKIISIIKNKFIIKLFFLVAIVSIILFSCKKEKVEKLENGIDKNYGNENKDIVIFSTNDAFSSYEKNLGYAGIKNFLNNFDTNENYFSLVDTGNFSTGNEVAEKSKGKSSIEIMEKVGYEIIVPGVNEFAYGLTNFFDNMDNFNGDVVCCNMLDTEKKTLLFNPYVIYKYGDTKIAYIGVITPDTLYKNEKLFFDENGKQLIYFFEDETGNALYNQIQACVDSAIKEGANKIVLLGGLGVNNVTQKWSVTEVISHTHNIDAVIDGYSKELIENGLTTNNSGSFVPIVQAESHLKYLGAMNITKDKYAYPAIISKNTIKSKDENLTNEINNIINKYKY